MQVELEEPVNSAMTDKVVFSEGDLSFVYSFKETGDWVYGHLAKLKLFEKGKKTENIHKDEVQDVFKLMLVREHELSEKFWLSVIEYAKTLKNRTHKRPNAYIRAKAGIFHGEFPAAAVEAARESLAGGVEDWLLVRRLYIESFHSKHTIVFSEEGQSEKVISERILDWEYNKDTRELVYWVVEGVEIDE